MDMCVKMGKLVMNVLSLNHPEPTLTDVEELCHYDEMAKMFKIDTTAEIVEHVVKMMQGATGLVGINVAA